MHDLGPDSSEYRALAGLENKKGQHTLAWIARAAGLKLFCAFPRPLERFAFLDLALFLTSAAEPTWTRALIRVC